MLMQPVRTDAKMQVLAVEKQDRIVLDQFVSIEPSNPKFFDQKANESIKTSHASPVKPHTDRMYRTQTLQAFQSKEKQQILSLVEMQKLRARRMKQMRKGAEKLRLKTEAAVKI